MSDKDLDLEQLYATPEEKLQTSNVMQILQDIDTDLITLDINGKKIKVANQSFVMSMKALVTSLISTVTSLEKLTKEQQREIGRLKSRIQTVENKTK